MCLVCKSVAELLPNEHFQDTQVRAGGTCGCGEQRFAQHDSTSSFVVLLNYQQGSLKDKLD